MDGYGSSTDDAERRRHRRSDATRKRGARRWLNHGSRPPPAFERRKLVEYKCELARRRHASSGSSAVGSSFPGASSSRLTLVTREPEELVSLVIKLEPDMPPRRGVIGPEDHLPPGQEEHLEHVILERLVREQEVADTLHRRELDYKRIFFEQGVAASQAHTSKEADLHVMKAEQAKDFIDLYFDEDRAPSAPLPRRRRHELSNFGS